MALSQRSSVEHEPAAEKPESRPDTTHDEVAPDVPDPRTEEERRADFAKAVWWQVGVFGSGLVAALVVITVYALTGDDKGETFSLLVLFACAASLSGAFFGFLFGIPRTPVAADKGTTDGKAVTQNVPSVTGSATGNTNLEQISDWLTKILVGATITQLGNIPGAASSLFTSMAAALAPRASAPAFVGGLTIFSALLGFIFGWIVTRTYVGWIVSSVEYRLRPPTATGR